MHTYPPTYLPTNYLPTYLLTQCASACSAYEQFLSRGRLLTSNLMLQVFLQSHLISAFPKLYGRYNNAVYNYKLSLSHTLYDNFDDIWHIDYDSEYLCINCHETRHTADVTGRQDSLTSPRHLILYPVYHLPR
jgi:hypothetical protein